jgi:purine-cytosine permease-like protein
MPFILFGLLCVILLYLQTGFWGFIVFLLMVSVPLALCTIVGEGEDLRTKQGWKGFAAGVVSLLVLSFVFFWVTLGWDDTIDFLWGWLSDAASIFTIFS